MELYQAEYMVGGTGTVAIESDSDLRCELGSFSMQDGFSNIERISEKNILRFVRIAMVGEAGAVSRVKMNAKERRP
jgi:hypothetical protein